MASIVVMIGSTMALLLLLFFSIPARVVGSWDPWETICMIHEKPKAWERILLTHKKKKSLDTQKGSLEINS